MTARPWPNRITRAQLANRARGFVYVPRVGPVAVPAAIPYIDAHGWTSPYFDDEGNPIREDGVNVGTIGPGLDQFVPALTDDDGTTRQLRRRDSGQWGMRRTPPDNFGNLDWRNADASEALNWIGPPSRYWGFANSPNAWYQPRIYRRGRLYATAPEDVIGCALYREDATRVLVAATTAFTTAQGNFVQVGAGQEFADGQVDETNLYCRIAGSEPDSTALWDGDQFDNLVAQYENATSDDERETLRAEIEAFARRWHDLELRGHADLIDTSVPEMQSAQYPNRRIGTDIWPMHFNASGTQGQALRRQSAHSVATLANGADVSSDVREYRYERIKLDIAYNVSMVTVAGGTAHEFSVTTLAPVVTPTRIHGDRMPRLDVTPTFQVSNTSEEKPTSSSNGDTWTSLDVDNSMAVNVTRTGTVTAAVDYIGDAEVFGYVDIDESVEAQASILCTLVREFEQVDFNAIWFQKSQSAHWDSTFGRTYSATFRWAGGTIDIIDVDASGVADTDVDIIDFQSSGNPGTTTLSYSATVTERRRDLDFVDLRTGYVVARERETVATLTSSLAPDRRFRAPTGEPYSISGSETDVGWQISGARYYSSDAAPAMDDALTVDGELHTSVSRTRTERVILSDGLIPSVLFEAVGEDITDEAIEDSGHDLVSLFIPPFDTHPDSLATNVWAGPLQIRGTEAVGYEGDYVMLSSGEGEDQRALGGLDWTKAAVGNWATNHIGDVIGSRLVSVPVAATGETEYHMVNHLTGGDLVALNELIVPSGEQAAFYNCAFAGD